MVDFFGHQERARRQTGKLIFYFVVSVGVTICLVYLVLAFAFLRGGEEQTDVVERLWNSRLFMWTSAGTLAIVFLGSLMKIIELSAGGKVVAEMLGGRLLDRSTTDFHERQLLNVVEEMAIASGVPVPDTYLLDHEEGINAFAAGNSINDAVIGVTRGCMTRLTRDELQGVMAHEYSHILNGDMRLNLRLTGWIHGLLCIAIIGRILLQFGGSSRSSSRDGKGGNPLPLVGLALMIVGGVGMLFAKLIKAAVSRQREFLADASAVQFTRNPSGIAGALKKIGGLTSRLETPKAEEASHLFFGNGLGSSFIQAFATHPPLEERIRRIEPDFDGHFLKSSITPAPGEESALASGFSGGQAPAPPPTEAPRAVSANRVMEQIGRVDTEHLSHARRIMAGLPPLIHQATREPFSAVALAYALLLSSDPETRRRQMELLETHENLAIVAEVNLLEAAVNKLHPRTRIPLVELAIPALRQLSPSQYATFTRTIKALSEADRQIDLFEFTLEKTLYRHLSPAFNGDIKSSVRFSAIDSVINEANILLSALAGLSHSDPDKVDQSYAAGIRSLDLPQLSRLPLEQCGLDRIDTAMDRLAAADERVKQKIVNACTETVTADGEIRVEEAELLRAICAVLDIPCPPLL